MYDRTLSGNICCVDHITCAEKWGTTVVGGHNLPSAQLHYGTQCVLYTTKLFKQLVKYVYLNNTQTIAHIVYELN